MSCDNNNEELLEIIIGSRFEGWVQLTQDGSVFPLDGFTVFELVFCPPGEDEIVLTLPAPTNLFSGEIYIQLTASQTAQLSAGISDAYLRFDQTPSDPFFVSLKNKVSVSTVC